MKSFFLGIFTTLFFASHAQSDAAAKAKDHMYKALTVANGVLIQHLDENITRAPWEALAYMHEDKMSTVDDLQEAVGDYYYFKNNLLQLKLIDPNNLSEFGTNLTVPYKIEDGESILLIDPKSNQVKESWQILYLDKNYLALDMGDIRVFFIHTLIKD